jgi:hypothetical protein
MAVPTSTKSSRSSHSGIVTHWTPHPAALDRIIAAVDKQRHDRDRLAVDLSDAWSKWLFFRSLDSDQGARARRKLFSAIADSADNLRERLLEKSDTAADGELTPRAEYALRNLFFGASHRRGFLAELDRLINKARDLERDNSAGGWIRLERSPKEWLAAEVLPPIFERNFGCSAGLSRNPNTGKVGGPFVRFVMTVMREWGLGMTAETIARALKQVRAGKQRRKRRLTTIARHPGW